MELVPWVCGLRPGCIEADGRSRPVLLLRRRVRQIKRGWHTAPALPRPGRRGHGVQAPRGFLEDDGWAAGGRRFSHHLRGGAISGCASRGALTVDFSWRGERVG